MFEVMYFYFSGSGNVYKQEFFTTVEHLFM